MAAPDNRLRLIVGNAPGARSGLWHIFTVRDDIYVQHAGMRKDMKTSLHASGANHVKWTPNGASRWAPNGDGYMMKWGEPEEFTPGGRTLLGIVIPTDHLSVPDEEPPLSQREKITLLAPAAPGEAITVSVVLTAPGTRLTAPESQASALLAHWTLPTRGEVWIVATGGPWDGFRDAVVAALPQMLEQLAAGIGHTLQPGDRNEGRAVLWTDLDRASVAHMIEVGVEYGAR
jgi:hypothetical protein